MALIVIFGFRVSSLILITMVYECACFVRHDGLLFQPGEGFKELVGRYWKAWRMPYAPPELRYTILQASRIPCNWVVAGAWMVRAKAAGLLTLVELRETAAFPAHLVHRYSTAEVYLQAGKSADRPLDARRLARVMDFIRSSLDTELTVAQMAEVACMSPAHFALSFRLATGSPLHAFVSNHRLAVAKMRLLSDDSPIHEIAASAGFSSQANFAKAFRNAVGMTPSEFRSSRWGNSGATSGD